MSPNDIPPDASVEEARVSIEDGVVVPSPRRLVLSFQKKLALFCERRPPVPMNGTDPAVRPERKRLDVVSPVVEAFVMTARLDTVRLDVEALPRVVRPPTVKPPVVDALANDAWPRV